MRGKGRITWIIGMAFALIAVWSDQVWAWPNESHAPILRVEQDDSALSFDGLWHEHASSLHSGGSAVLAITAGARATFTFTGSGVRWIGNRDESSGIAKVFVDGELKATVDTFAVPSQAQAVLFSIEGLPASSHTLVIEVTETKNGNSDGAWVCIDRVEVLPLFLRENRSVAYSGVWHINDAPERGGDSAILAKDAGSRVIFSFIGSGVRWIGDRDEGSGIARVFLDGQLQATVDTFASPAQSRAVLFSVDDLPIAPHTLMIEVTGARGAASAGPWIWINGFEID